MNITLPEELIQLVKDQIPACRLQTIIVHGVEATGKSLALDRLLPHLQIPYAVIRSKECITTRHLLERTVSSVKQSLTVHDDSIPLPDIDGRCENLAIFVATLQQLLNGRDRFILVFDNIDRQREAAPTLLPALCRLGEIIPSITTILVLRLPSPHLFSHAAIPHIEFPPYKPSELLQLLSPSPFPTGSLSSTARTSSGEAPPYTYSEEDTRWLWTRFLGHMWDALGQGAARDIVSLRRVCEKLWQPFIQPIIDGQYGVRGSQELPKLLVRHRALLQSEAALIPSIIPIPMTSVASSKPAAKTSALKLPYIPANLLISAFLASHTPPKNDIALFSRSSHSKRRKRGGGTAATPNRPSKKNTGIHSRRRLMGPQPFPLERCMAIFHAVTEGDVAGGTAEVLVQWKTLAGLRLVSRAGAGAGGDGGDVLEAGGGKWRCVVGEEFVKGVARGVGVDLEEYTMD